MILEMQKQEDQQEIFEKIKHLTFELKAIGRHVQSPFGRMLRDGHITKKEIADEILVMEHEFDTVIEKIIVLKDQAKELMQHYAND